MKTSKLLARAVLPAGAALLSLTAWAVASSSMPIVSESSESPGAIARPAAEVAPSAAEVAPPAAVIAPLAVVEEPVLAPQVGNMKYSCRVAQEVSAAAPQADQKQ